MVTIAVVLFSALSLIILNPLMSYATSESFLPTTLTCRMDASTPNTIVVEHRGGEPLKHYRITYTISTGDDPPVVTKISKTEVDAGLGEWIIGECCRYTAAGNLSDMKVEVEVVDTQLGAMLLRKVVQDRDAFTRPYVEVYNPNDVPDGVTEASAVLRLYYNFVRFEYYYCPNPGTVSFNYQLLDVGGNPISNQTSSLASPLPLDGWYSITLTGLAADSHYRVRAIIQWGSSSNQTPFVEFWTYANARGLWHFDEALAGGGGIAFDAARPAADGVLHGANFVADMPHNNGYVNVSAAHQYVSVPNDYKFDLKTAMTVREWVCPQVGGSMFYGQVSMIDNASLSLPSTWIEPKVIHITGDVYACVYHTSVDPGSTITTFHLADSGMITEPLSVIDSQIFLIGNYRNSPDILALGNDLYVVSYGSRCVDTLPRGFLMTVSISTDGAIGDLSIDQVMTNEFLGQYSQVFHVSGSLYAAVFGGDYSKTYSMMTGGIVTFTIDELGQFSTLLSTVKFSEDFCSRVDVVNVGNNVFCLAYNSDNNGTGCIATVQIDGSGHITVLDKEYATLAECMQPCIVSSGSPNCYLIASGGDAAHPLQGIIQIVTITSGGTIVGFTSPNLFPSAASVEPEICPMPNHMFLIAYSEGNPSGHCRAFTLKATDHIEFRDEIEFFVNETLSTLQGLHPTIVGINTNGSHYLVIYGSEGSITGMMTTLDVNFISSPQMAIRKGEMFQIEVVDTTVIATMKIGGVSQSLSGTLVIGGWNHVVLTYSAFTFTLYINGAPSSQIVCSGNLEYNTDQLIIGDGFLGFLDEVGIYAQAFDATGVANDYTATNLYV